MKISREYVKETILQSSNVFILIISDFSATITPDFIQKLFWYVDLVLKKMYTYFSVLKTVMLNIFVKYCDRFLLVCLIN